MQALWMLVAAFMFASMGVCVKIASADFSTAELVFYRGLVGMVLRHAAVDRDGDGAGRACPMPDTLSAAYAFGESADQYP